MWLCAWPGTFSDSLFFFSLSFLLFFFHLRLLQSVNKTGRLVVSHEAPVTGGFAAEIASRVADKW